MIKTNNFRVMDLLRGSWVINQIINYNGGMSGVSNGIAKMIPINNNAVVYEERIVTTWNDKSSKSKINKYLFEITPESNGDYITYYRINADLQIDNIISSEQIISRLHVCDLTFNNVGNTLCSSSQYVADQYSLNVIMDISAEVIRIIHLATDLSSYDRYSSTMLPSSCEYNQLVKIHEETHLVGESEIDHGLPFT